MGDIKRLRGFYGLKIALVGKARSGKDTVADYLVDRYKYKEYKFSTGVRDVINLVRGEDKHKNRRELQLVGQGLRAFLGDDVWINYTFNAIEEDDNVVISDCRQDNEAEALRKQGYLLVKIECDDDVRVKRMLAAGDKFTSEDLKHETEQIDIECDVVLYNDGGLEDLYLQVDEFINKVTEDRE